MSYVEQWRALSARIRALAEAGHLHAAFQQASATDHGGAGKYLAEQCNDVLDRLESFVKSNERVLPLNVVAAFNRFLSGETGKKIGIFGSNATARAVLVFLASFESEISFLLADRQELIKARSERAFLHLQRLLVVDADVRAKWKEAFENGGEISCEALGAVHLLSHGIFAFKINAAGARTDLLYNDAIDELAAERASEGFVLTEWKLANEKNAAARFEEARKQTELYQHGVLASSELRNCRYLIAVSMRDLSPTLIPADQTISGVAYRNINIAIEPDVPSRRARR
jgi:hypothetical protein